MDAQRPLGQTPNIRQFRDFFHKTLEETNDAGEVAMFFRLLVEAYLGMSRIEISLNLDRPLTEQEFEKLEGARKRLLQHEPVQYIIGETEFFGLPFKVNRNVLIPRPETEELVSWILDDHRSLGNPALKILDIGTGSGCIAISLAHSLPNAQVTALDISEAALKVAKQNAEFNGVTINFLLQDVLSLPALHSDFDIIVSNPPYVRELEKQEMRANVLENEPDTALFVKDDNALVFYEKITKLAQQAFKPQGSLYFEINQYLGPETETLLKNSGFETELRKDFLGNDRMLKGKR